MKQNKPKIIVVLGPTACGKSDLAVELAKKFNGEVISADSRQVYRGMDLGSGKITKKEMQGIPHYLLDVASPKQRFSAGQFQKMAQKAIKKIQAKDKISIVCGGTGFYIRAVAENLSIPEVKPDLKLRGQLEKKSAENLFGELKRIDPERALNIDSKNKRRLVRTLEIIYKTGQPVTPLEPKENPNETLFIGIKKPEKELKKRIALRLEKRLKQGMIKEVQNLRKSGLSWKRLESFGLEYKWIALFLQDKITRQEMILRLQKDSEHFAKRQLVFFKKYPGQEKIRWVKNKKQAALLIEKFLKQKLSTKLFGRPSI
ncbi:MAG: tRNA (adenosine(37)-N6)-dimethylallyltransferase MiaA [Candidatus Portnoybacteria bacterium]|nr:tRNA (adenosine(37)-N6)-dimethylallyltransferase MiaA [Candidatus Portnoybacteria bacterium]